MDAREREALEARTDVKTAREMVQRLKKESFLLKWLAVTIGSYRIMPGLTNEVRARTPLRVRLSERRMEKIKTLFAGDDQMLEAMTRLERIMGGEAPQNVDIDLNRFQDLVFDRVVDVDHRLAGMRKDQVSRVHRIRTIQPGKAKAMLTGRQATFIDFGVIGRDTLNRGEQHVLLEAYRTSLKALHFDARRMDRRNDWSIGFASFKLVVGANQRALKRQLRQLGLEAYIVESPADEMAPDRFKGWVERWQKSRNRVKKAA